VKSFCLAKLETYTTKEFDYSEGCEGIFAARVKGISSPIKTFKELIEFWNVDSLFITRQRDIPAAQFSSLKQIIPLSYLRLVRER
jgi:hypothetical protein